MVVKADVAVNHFVRFGKGSWFVSVNTFRFEDREEIFRHSIVIRISSPSGKPPRPCGRWVFLQCRARRCCGGRYAAGFRSSPKSRW